MMQKYFYVLLVLAFASCKKESDPLAKALPAKDYTQENRVLSIDSVLVLEYENPMLAAFYRKHDYKTFWGIPANRKLVDSILAKADAEGLESADYSLPKLLAYEQKINSISDKEVIVYDILLTLSLQKYLLHLVNGKLNPRDLYANWDLKRNPSDVNQWISDGVKGDSLETVVEKAKPQHIVYKRLKKALAVIDSLPDDDVKKVVSETKIRIGDTTKTILTVKKRLQYWKDLDASDSLTWIYDKKTAEAVKKFQRRHGLLADGVIGRGTILALNFSKAQRREQIIANLERWRWFPRNMGSHYIIVNIPGYHLRVVKDNDTIEMKKVVVGTFKRKTPVLSSTFSNIVLNPTWTVPPTILKEDLVPSATKDRNYFAMKEITIINWKGDTIAAEDWNPEKPNSYRYVQSPGDHNSLGNVKFNFPNHYTVYLHDTNHRNFFGMNDRSLSSGCVRVENPLELAEYLLDDKENWSLEKIQEVIASKVTTSISIRKQNINIHQLYWTAWMDVTGDLEFRTDIYNLDTDLYARLRK